MSPALFSVCMLLMASLIILGGVSWYKHFNKASYEHLRGHHNQQVSIPALPGTKDEASLLPSALGFSVVNNRHIQVYLKATASKSFTVNSSPGKCSAIFTPFLLLSGVIYEDVLAHCNRQLQIQGQPTLSWQVQEYLNPEYTQARAKKDNYVRWALQVGAGYERLRNELVTLQESLLALQGSVQIDAYIDLGTAQTESIQFTSQVLMHHIVLKGQVFQMVNPSSNVVFRSKPEVLYGRPMSALDSWIMVEKCGSSMGHDMTFVNMKAKASAITYSQRYNLDTGALEWTSFDVRR